jgi:hypothetical protein
VVDWFLDEEWLWVEVEWISTDVSETCVCAVFITVAVELCVIIVVWEVLLDIKEIASLFDVVVRS